MWSGGGDAEKCGVRLPLVYNSSIDDSIGYLVKLQCLRSIYRADLRYASNSWGSKFSQVADYVEKARAAIREMYRQVGELTVDDDGIAQKGLIVRHLILPHRLAGSEDSLGWLVREVSPEITVSIMAQYFPAHRAAKFPLLSRTILSSEYFEVTRLLSKLGIENGWVQEMGSSEDYLPDLACENQPFSPVVNR